MAAANMLIRELDRLTAEYDVPKRLFIQAVGPIDEASIVAQVKLRATATGFDFVTSTTKEDHVTIRILSYAETPDESVLKADIVWGARKGYIVKLTQRGDVYGREIIGQH
jgi:hypothetical protein